MCCILCLHLYLPSSLSSSSILFLVPVVFLAPLVSTRHPALHLCFPGGSSPACPTPSGQLYTLPAPHQLLRSAGFLVFHRIPWLKHYLFIKRLLGGARPHCWFCVVAIGSYTSRVPDRINTCELHSIPIINTQGLHYILRINTCELHSILNLYTESTPRNKYTKLRINPQELGYTQCYEDMEGEAVLLCVW